MFQSGNKESFHLLGVQQTTNDSMSNYLFINPSNEICLISAHALRVSHAHGIPALKEEEPFGLVDENPTNDVQDHSRKTFSKQTFAKSQ